MKHIPHIEDLLFSGREGFETAYASLLDLHNALCGGPRVAITTKMDGAPALVFGYHPKFKKFFVATKAFYNKVPKLNFSEFDISANHGSGELADKLKIALQYLPAIVKEGVFQGDLMYTKDTVQWGHNPRFTPNTITYVIPHNVKAYACFSKLGIAIHTQFRGDDMQPEYEVDDTYLRWSDNVHRLDTRIDLSKVVYHQYDRERVLHHLELAAEQMRHINLFFGWGNVERFVSTCVKLNKIPTAEYFVEMHSPTKFHPSDVAQYDCMFNAHLNLTNAKNVIMDIIDRHSPFDHYIGDAPSKPEGYVLSIGGKAMKLVDRYEFSRINQLQGRFREKTSVCI